jgi:hypothetical protein
MAGAGYKLFATGDVLTAAQVNTYLNEQTVMVFADSAARTTALSGVLAEGMMSYLQDTNAVEVYNGSSWVNVGNAGDITEVQAGVGISIASGTGPIPVITNSSTDLITTAGDLLYGTAADTVARLGIGTAGQVLQVNSGATAPEWATAAGGGGFTLINSGGTTLSGDTTVSSIPGTHKHLLITIHDASATGGGNNLFLRMNGDSGSNYRYNWIRNITTTLAGDAGTTTGLQIQSRVQTGTGFVDGLDAYIWIYNYTNTDYVFASWGGSSTDGSSTVVFNTGSGKYDCTAAITSITVGCADSLDNGTVYVYGVS